MSLTFVSVFSGYSRSWTMIRSVCPSYLYSPCYVFTVFLSFFTAKSQAPVHYTTHKNSPTPTHVPLPRFSPSLFLILTYHDHTVQRQSNKSSLGLSKEHMPEAGLVQPVRLPDRRPPPRTPNPPSPPSPTRSTPR